MSGRERLAFRSNVFFLLVDGVPEAPLKMNGVNPEKERKKASRHIIQSTMTIHHFFFSSLHVLFCPGVLLTGAAFLFACTSDFLPGVGVRGSMGDMRAGVFTRERLCSLSCVIWENLKKKKETTKMYFSSSHQHATLPPITAIVPQLMACS